MAKELTKRLLELKESAGKAKAEKHKAEGELKGHTDRLQKEYRLRTVPAAKIKLEELEKEIMALDKALEQGVEAMEEKYGHYGQN